MKEYKVEYQTAEQFGTDHSFEAIFYDLESARLWWDSIRYLRTLYRPLSLRP
jgi:hypothetical protein